MEKLKKATLEDKQAKAEKYAAKPWRLAVDAAVFTMKGEHGIHSVAYLKGQWYCSCQFFAGHRTCSHVMGAGKILAPLTIKQPAGNEEERHE